MAELHTDYRSTLDSIFPPVIQSWILCFPCEPSAYDTIASSLREGLNRTLDQDPRLGGELVWEDIGRLKLVYSDKRDKEDERFTVNDLTNNSDVWSLSYTDLAKRGAPVAALKRHDVLSPPGGYQRLASLPVSGQANFIPGGCLLYVTLHHSLMDGTGAATILSAWARNCKAAQDGDVAKQVPALSLSLPEVLQGTAAPLGADIDRIREDATLWQALGLQKPTNDPPNWAFPSGEGLVPAIFGASAAAISRLKAASAPATGFISSFDAIAALVWRCVMRARYSDLGDTASDITSNLRLPVNVRQAVGIPEEYSGNAILFSVTSMSLDSLVAEKDGSRLAAQVRSSLSKTKDPSRARDAVKLSFVLPPPSGRVPDFSRTATHDVILSSWQDMPFYQMDWGAAFGSPGVPEFVRTDQLYSLPGLCAILQKRTGDEVEAVINLSPDQIDRLREDAEFGNYFQLKSM